MLFAELKVDIPRAANSFAVEIVFTVSKVLEVSWKRCFGQLLHALFEFALFEFAFIGG